MNLTGLLNFKSALTDGELNEIEEMYLSVANSLEAVIEEYFVKVAPSFIIVLSCRYKSRLYFIENVMQLLFNTILNMHVQIIYVDPKRPQRFNGLRMHNLLFVDSFEAFRDIDVISYSHYGTNEYYHIFLKQHDRKIYQDMESIFRYCLNYDILNCNIQYQNKKGDIFLYTYFPFTFNRCHSNEPQLIDTFIGNSWINKTYFLQKLKNFYSCPLVAVVRNIPPYSYITTAADGSLSFSGFEIDMFKYLAQKMNFTLVLRTRIDDDRSISYDSGALKMVADRKADVAFGFYLKRPDDNNRFSTTFPHYQVEVVSVIYLNAHLLNTFEVLLYPFEYYVWYAVLLSMVILVVGTRLMRRNGKPTMSIFSVIASGIGAPIQERPNLPHSVLLFLTWVWSSFIIRIIYSELLFHLLRYKVYSFIPRNLNEAISNNFDSVMNQLMYNEVKNIPAFENSQNGTGIVLPSENALAALFYLEESKIKNLYAITSFDFFKIFLMHNNRNEYFHLVPETIVQQQLCIYMIKHSILIKQFDQEIMFARSSGLFKFWAQKYIGNYYIIRDQLYKDAYFVQADLWSIYVVCCAIYFIAFVIFLFEFLSLKVKFFARVLK